MCMPQINCENSSIYNGNVSFLEKSLWDFHCRFSICARKGCARAIPDFRLHGGHHFSADDMCWWRSVCFSRAGARKKRQGQCIWYRQSTKPQRTRKQLFFMCGFCRVVLLNELQAGKTRQRTSQKPCLLLLGTWQCERCKWHVAMCNRQIEIMDCFSWWISIGIRCYQSLMWNMQRLYSWGAWCSSPKSSQRCCPPTLACTTPLPNQRKSCISMVVWSVCTDRYRLCRVCVSYLHLSKQNKNQFRRKTNVWGDQTSLCMFYKGVI